MRRERRVGRERAIQGQVVCQIAESNVLNMERND